MSFDYKILAKDKGLKHVSKMGRHKKAKKAILFGTSRQAQVFDYYLTKDSPYDVEAFTCSGQYRDSDYIFDKPLVDFETIEKVYPPETHDMHIAVAHYEQNHLRAKFYRQAREKGYKLLNYICSRATCLTEEIEDNIFIMEHATVQPFARLGPGVVLGSGSHVGQHTHVEDFCFLEANAVVAGHCRVGHHTTIGANATVRERISVGFENEIGAGCLIIKDTKPNEVFLGSKASVFQGEVK